MSTKGTMTRGAESAKMVSFTFILVALLQKLSRAPSSINNITPIPFCYNILYSTTGWHFRLTFQPIAYNQSVHNVLYAPLFAQALQLLIASLRLKSTICTLYPLFCTGPTAAADRLAAATWLSQPHPSGQAAGGQGAHPRGQGAAAGQPPRYGNQQINYKYQTKENKNNLPSIEKG